jgi:hypothetical protein
MRQTAPGGLIDSSATTPFQFGDQNPIETRAGRRADLSSGRRRLYSATLVEPKRKSAPVQLKIRY